MELDVQVLKNEVKDIYLGMTLMVTGFKVDMSEERVRNGGQEARNLVGQKWWSVGMPTAQIAALLNSYVRSKYRYGLIVTVVGPTVAELYQK